MAEYIEREPLIKVLKKWCDDAGMGDNEYAYSLADDLLHEVNALPAVDIDRPTKSQFKRMAAQMGYEPVVHCEVCKHQENIEGYSNAGGYCVLHSSSCAGYCGDGEYKRNTEGEV